MQPTTPILAKFVEPNAGYKAEQEAAKHLLKEGEYYKVSRISIGQSSTSVGLHYFSCSFNSVHFEFYNEDKTPTDIYSRQELNPYLPTGRSIFAEEYLSQPIVTPRQGEVL